MSRRRRDPDRRVQRLREQLAKTTNPIKRAEIEMHLEWIAEERTEAKQADREAGIW